MSVKTYVLGATSPWYVCFTFPKLMLEKHHHQKNKGYQQSVLQLGNSYETKLLENVISSRN